MKIKEKLQILNPIILEVKDVSYKHTSHLEEAKAGGTHFEVTIVSDRFAGKSKLQRHKMVYTILSEELSTHVHALSLKTLTPKEWQS